MADDSWPKVGDVVYPKFGIRNERYVVTESGEYLVRGIRMDDYPDGPEWAIIPNSCEVDIFLTEVRKCRK